MAGFVRSELEGNVASRILKEESDMNGLQVFTHEELGSVRTLEVDGEAWFVGKDVAEILGYTNASKALADHVDSEDKLNNESLSSLGQRGGWLINESGLYSLILSSKLPKAKVFKPQTWRLRHRRDADESRGDDLRFDGIQDGAGKAAGLGGGKCRAKAADCRAYAKSQLL